MLFTRIPGQIIPQVYALSHLLIATILTMMIDDDDWSFKATFVHMVG